MDKSKHSLLPFEVKLNYDNLLSETIDRRHTIKDAEGWNIARIWEDGGNPEANANFIVRACNSHDALLAACKAVATSTHQIYPDNSSEYQIGVADGHRCAANIVKAAIALAEKEG